MGKKHTKKEHKKRKRRHKSSSSDSSSSDKYRGRKSSQRKLKSSNADMPLIGPTLPQQHSTVANTEARKNIIGPELPSDYRQEENIQSLYDNDRLSPQVPNVSNIIDPTSPSDVIQSRADSTQAADEAADEVSYGPTLPPKLIQKSSVVEVENNYVHDRSTDDDSDGGDPFIRPFYKSAFSADVDVSGDTSQHFKTRNKPTNKRESWMTELPEDRSAVNHLGARKFKVRNIADKGGDRSVWTETPDERSQKKEENPLKSAAELLETAAVAKRNKMMDEIVKKTNRESKSLVDLHREKQKKIEKEKKDKGEPRERRPFDRNIDLQINRMNDEQAKSIMNKAQFLNSRFSQGQSKYL